MNILILSTFGKILPANFLAGAFSNYANVLKIGPHMRKEDFAQMLEDEKNHLFKKSHESRQNINELRNDIVKGDLFFPPGDLDSKHLLNVSPDTLDLILWVDTNNLFMSNFEALKDLKAIKAAYIFNTHTKPEYLERRIEYAKNFDIIFLTFKHDIPLFKKVCRHVYWLPFAFDPDIYYKTPLKIEYDWSFIGQTNPSHHLERVQTIRKLYRNKSFNGHVATAFLGKANEYFNKSKVVLNRSLNNDLNMRVFEALGSGSLLFTDKLKKNNGIYDLFNDKKNLIMYENENELIELMSFYLNKPDLCEKISGNGYRLVHEKHTYDHRAKTIMDIVQKQKQKQVKYFHQPESTLYIGALFDMEELKVIEETLKDKSVFLFTTNSKLSNKLKSVKYISPDHTIEIISEVISGFTGQEICFINNKKYEIIKKTDYLRLIKSKKTDSLSLLKQLHLYFPNSTDILYKIGKIYQKNEEYDNALHFYALALKKGSMNKKLRCSLKYCLTNIKK